MTSSVNLINSTEKRFQNLVFLTVIIIYLLILAGGIVRGTGSGMGCPDWPKCFGRWVPPTNISQLPYNYQEIYGAKLKGEIQFNAIKTWIEYINRLLGVLSGFFVLSVLIVSFHYLKKDKAVFWGSVIAFLLVGSNGWLGSQVVATELAQYVVTIHFLLAIAVVFALLFVLVRSSSIPPQVVIVKNSKTLRLLLLIILLATLGQIIFGTQVRDALDSVIKELGYEGRENWIDNLKNSFYIHRSFSIVVFVLHIVIIYKLRQITNNTLLLKMANVLIALVIIEIVTGIIMAYFNVPAVAQPVHLLLAVMIIGLQFVAWLMLDPAIIYGKAAKHTAQFIRI